MCISFCDPDQEDCTASSDAAGACDESSAKEVDHPKDLVPTIDEMAGLAESVATGEFDNSEFRVIPAKDTIEAHIQFDFHIDTMLELSETVLTEAALDLLNGRSISITIPYQVEGTLFFDVPELGRYAFGFGPLEDDWEI